MREKFQILEWYTTDSHYSLLQNLNFSLNYRASLGIKLLSNAVFCYWNRYVYDTVYWDLCWLQRLPSPTPFPKMEKEIVTDLEVSPKCVISTVKKDY